MKINVLMIGAVVLGLAAAPALTAQQPTTAEKAHQTMAAGNKAPDETFVTKTAAAGMAEVELGKMAAEKAGSEEVKKFAQRMVDDHSKANEELKALAQQKNITLPDATDPHLKAMQDRLSKSTGAAFDRAYMQMMITDHRKAANEFRLASRAAKDPEIKSWAAKTLPTIEEHLKMAQTTHTGVGTSGVKK
jgi:putative membrane protein